MKRSILALSLALMIGAVACKDKGTEGTEPATTDSTQVVTDSTQVVADSTQKATDAKESEAPKADEAPKSEK
jgi:hypothetical protein